MLGGAKPLDAVWRALVYFVDGAFELLEGREFPCPGLGRARSVSGGPEIADEVVGKDRT